MSNCPFCESRADENTHLYQDEVCYIILDKYPASEGHLLIVSNGHYKNMMEAPDEVVKHMFVVAKNYFRRMWDRMEPVGGSVVTNTGPEHISHFHIHIIPRYGNTKTVALPRHSLTPEEEASTRKKLSL